MTHQHHIKDPNPPEVSVPPVRLDPKRPPVGASSPRVTVSNPISPRSCTETPTYGAARKIAIAFDLSDESAFAVKWAVDHYVRPGDAVVLLHVRPTSILYGADWGSVDFSSAANNSDSLSAESKQKLEDDFDAFTISKAADLAQPLSQAQVPYTIHIVKDHDMRERLCLEVERLNCNAVIMGSRGFGALRRGSDGKLGSVSDYCVRHCVCPVVVVRSPDEKNGSGSSEVIVSVVEASKEGDEQQEYHDASKEHKDVCDASVGVWGWMEAIYLQWNVLTSFPKSKSNNMKWHLDVVWYSNSRLMLYMKEIQ